MADMNEVKDLIEAQGRTWEEFKKTNNQRIEKLEKQGATGDQDAKLAKIDADLTSLGKTLAEVQLAAQRPNLGDGKMSAEKLEHKRAIAEYLRKGSTDGLREIEKKAMNSLTDSEGGFLVDEEFEAAIDRVAQTQGGLASQCRVVTIGTRSWQKRIKTSGMSMARVAEGATAGETTEPKFAQVEIVAHPAEVEPWVNNETLEDADIDLAADLAMEAGIAFAEGEGLEFFSGNGVGKARGITAYSIVANGSYAWGSIGYMPTGKAAAFASSSPADKIVDFLHALKPQYRPGASLVMADSTLAKVRQLKDGSGSYYLWNPDPSGGFTGRVLGVPVISDDNFSALASNAYVAAYGNFQRGYTIVRRTGTTLIRDNLTSKGVTKFNFRRRFGGGVVNYEAIKLLKASAS